MTWIGGYFPASRQSRWKFRRPDHCPLWEQEGLITFGLKYRQLASVEKNV